MKNLLDLLKDRLTQQPNFFIFGTSILSFLSGFFMTNIQNSFWIVFGVLAVLYMLVALISIRKLQKKLNSLLPQPETSHPPAIHISLLSWGICSLIASFLLFFMVDSTFRQLNASFSNQLFSEKYLTFIIIAMAIISLIQIIFGLYLKRKTTPHLETIGKYLIWVNILWLLLLQIIFFTPIYSLRQYRNSPSPSPTPVSNVIRQNEVEWQTYTHEIFSFQYPSDWILKESANGFSFTKYKRDTGTQIVSYHISATFRLYNQQDQIKN